MASSSSPCAACKFLRRKCTQGCVFAPYFPPDQPHRFQQVHKVFGASNVSKLLNDVSPADREATVNSLAYEAEARLHDPVYGCVGYISILQHNLKHVQQELYNAKKELAAYIGPEAQPLLPHSSVYAAQPVVGPQHQFNQGGAVASFGVSGMGAGLGLGAPGATQVMLREQQQQQHQQMVAVVEAQQMAMVAAAREQEILRSYEQQQQQELVRIGNSGLEGRVGIGFNQIGPSLAAATSSGGYPGVVLVPAQPIGNNPFHIQQQHQQHEEHQQQQQQQQPQHQRSGSDEGMTGTGPSS